MEVTDTHGISEPLRQLVEWALNQYDGTGAGTGRRVGVTSLIQPAQITTLMRQHDWELSIDVTDAIELLLGQSIALLLKHKTGLTDRESYARTTPDDHGNLWTVGGMPDYVFQRDHRIVIQDYKVTKASAIKHGVKPERVQQLSVYRWLLIPDYPMHLFEAENVNIIKDWNPYRLKSKGYPQKAVVVSPVELLSELNTKAFLQRRLTELEESLRIAPKPCTPEETWGGKRCERWCPVARWCQQFATAGAPSTEDEYMDTE